MKPQHIAIIMDGNRRWAREHNLPVIAGHKKVANDVLEKLVAHAAEVGIPYLTFWAFSTENWNRAADEVKGIMGILAAAIGPFGKKMMDKGVRLRVIGDLSRIDPKLQKGIADVVEKTKNNKRITVTVALNYGGRDEIRRAVATYGADFENHLDTAGTPDPDFIIRTGGEERLSGFLPWQSVYSELYFPAFFMPDFTPERLDEAIAEFEKRKRRFGK